MAPYHRYVFDLEKRIFVGEFEEMYQAEKEGYFDSWHQESLRTLGKQICLDILEQYNFSRIVDIGCGKGTFTHLLKKNNNHVVGIDVSESALKYARGKYHDIDFVQTDLASESWDKETLFSENAYDLVVLMETLSYLPNWEEVIEKLSKFAWCMLLSLFLPRDPIGFVKNAGSLVRVFGNSFEVRENIHLVNRETVVLFGSSKQNHFAGRWG